MHRTTLSEHQHQPRQNADKLQYDKNNTMQRRHIAERNRPRADFGQWRLFWPNN